MNRRINTIFVGQAAKPHVASSAGVGRGEMTQTLTTCLQLTAQTVMLAVQFNIGFHLTAFSAKKRFLVVYQGAHQKTKSISRISRLRRFSHVFIRTAFIGCQNSSAHFE